MKKIVLLLMLLCSVTLFGQDFARGKELFKQNCAACHNMERKLVGPPLQNVVAEQGRDWTKEWIYNSKALIDAGDEHAVEIWEEYNRAAMPAYNYLEDSDLESIVTYLQDYTKDKEERMAQVTAEVAPTTGETTVVQSQPIPTYLWIVLIIAGVITIAGVYAFYVGMNAIVHIVTKTTSTNTFLMKKLNTDSKELEKEFDSLVNKKASKEMKDKVKKLKKELNDKLNKFK
tara:strand:- start:1703 stop:2392 length:690 start_codon:yes stop_codon:yes gene_type:complete